MPQHNILITGGAGFIGSRLANFLNAGGHKVSVLDNLSTQIHGVEPESSPLFLSLHANIEFIRGSVTCRADLIKALHGVDIVVHLAAVTPSLLSAKSAAERAIALQTNVNMPLFIAQSAHKQGVKRFVFLSSCGVHGADSTAAPFTESSPYAGHNAYTQSKISENKQKYN